MSKSEAVAKRLADHGRHVFIYNHIWTNQVVYSLDRSMNNTHALKQLPFAGKKTLPPALRKDMWRPLLAVTFPTPPQGLHAFRKLREYRKLHELRWAAPDSSSSSSSSPSDPRNPTKKARGRIIMNQKANSIADLAQVLREQADLAGQKSRKDTEAREQDQHRIHQELLALTQEAERGGLQELDAAIADQGAAVKAMRRQKATKDPNAPTRSHILQSVTALKRLQTKREKMVAATGAVEAAKEQALAQGRAAESRGHSTPDSIDLTIDPPEVFYRPDPATRQKPSKSSTAPLYSTHGVVIRWTNPLDAEFAPSWPEGVVHDAAGLARHTAVAADEDAVFTTEELVARNTSHKYKALRAARDDEVPTELLHEAADPQQPTA